MCPESVTVAVCECEGRLLVVIVCDDEPPVPPNEYDELLPSGNLALKSGTLNVPVPEPYVVPSTEYNDEYVVVE